MRERKLKLGGGGRQKMSALAAGFTLLEMLLAITLLSVISSITYMSFNAAIRAWQEGIKLVDGIHHADYVLDQLTQGMRSSYYPEVSKVDPRYGWQIEDDGDGESGRDRLQWTKIGSALVGDHVNYAGAPHRVEVKVDDDDDGRSMFYVRSWPIYGLAEDFEPDDAPWIALTPGVEGLSVRLLDPEMEEDAEEFEWIEEWEDTNRIPYSVEVKVYIANGKEGEEPIEVSRIVSIPLADVSWNLKRGGRNRNRNLKKPKQRNRTIKPKPSGGRR